MAVAVMTITKREASLCSSKGHVRWQVGHRTFPKETDVISGTRSIVFVVSFDFDHSTTITMY